MTYHDQHVTVSNTAVGPGHTALYTRALNINEWDATEQPAFYICYGLGSCVGLFMVDRLTGLCGAAHIALPMAAEGSGYSGAAQLITQTLDKMRALGSNLSCVRAKVAGGAHVFETSLGIGAQNIRAVLTELTRKGVYLAAADLGGNISRTARFNSVTYQLHISTSEYKTYTI
jgi:chemotaxis protein CheD